MYLDDILVHGRSFEGALELLRWVLEKIKEVGLTLPPEKCRFMSREVTFLGHELGTEGIGTNGLEVGGWEYWPTPRNQGQLKGCIGLASYYQRHVPPLQRPCSGHPVVLSVRPFKYYLRGLPFTVRTDHSALQ